MVSRCNGAMVTAPGSTPSSVCWPSVPVPTAAPTAIPGSPRDLRRHVLDLDLGGHSGAGNRRVHFRGQLGATYQLEESGRDPAWSRHHSGLHRDDSPPPGHPSHLRLPPVVLRSRHVRLCFRGGPEERVAGIPPTGPCSHRRTRLSHECARFSWPATGRRIQPSRWSGGTDGAPAFGLG